MKTQNNMVRLTGNLGMAPEVREVGNGRKVARMSVATRQHYTNASGERVTDTQWHTVVAWGRVAEQAGQLLGKGAPVVLEGRLVHRKFEGRDGATRHVSEIILDTFTVLAQRVHQHNNGAKSAA